MSEISVYHVDTKTRELAFSFMARSILRSRVAMGLDAQTERFDEDVNVYLAHLLLSFADPGALEITKAKISFYDVDLAQQVDRSRDRVEAYYLYKANADYLLFSLGILRHLEREEHLQRFGLRPRRYANRARFYYLLASSCHQQIYRRPTSISEIFEKLSNQFHRYVAILNSLRSQFYSLHQTLRDQPFTVFLDELKGFEQDLQGKRLMDEFLDAYSAWLKEPTDAAKRRLDEAVTAVRALEPRFRFSTPSQDG